MRKQKFLMLTVLMAILCYSNLLAADYKGMYGMILPAEGSIDMQTVIDLKTVLNLGGQNMIGMMDPTRDYLPYWNLGNKMSRFMPSHNIGRWWDCMLRLEAATGFVIPANVEAGLMSHTQRFFDNPDHRMYPPFDDTRLTEDERKCTLHDLRENVLALTALVKYRNSQWARQKGHALIERLLVYMNEDGTWAFEKMLIGKDVEIEQDATWACEDILTGKKQDIKIDRSSSDPTGSHGRLLEALVLFYRETGDYKALELSECIARYHFKNSIYPDGSFNETSGAWHAHSYLNTLRGLLLYGELTGQRVYIDIVAKSYKKAIPETIIHCRSGFLRHNIGSTTSGGETSTAGDIAQLALWLGKRHGYTELLDDTERLVRARLVPSQIVHANITPAADLQGDVVANLSERVIGTIGGSFAEPYGKYYSTVDITAAGIHTLVDIYNNIVERTAQDVKVYLHFDIENNYISLKSRRADKATLNIDMKVDANLWVRMPRWAPADSIIVMQNDKKLAYEKMGDFIVIANQFTPGSVVITYDLPITKETEKVNETTYTLLWRGDEVIGIRPNIDITPIYPNLPEKYRKE